MREAERTATKQGASGRTRAIVNHLLGLVVFGLLSGWSVTYATGRYLPSFITGLAMACTIDVAYLLDRAFLHPRLKNLPHDWLQLGLEIALGLLEHIGGALLALFVCSRIFDFAIQFTTAWMIVGGILIGFPIIHGTETALRFRRQLREKERLEEWLRALAAQAELKALKAQINPHFLFNTLNTIAQLVHTDPVQAEATIERLAEMFQYVLAGSERGLVSLEEELAFVDGYLEIERARFGERLRVTREIDPRVLSIPVPSLILQPLVENVIKHGHGDDGRIALDIRIESVDEGVRITIADRGPGMPAGYRIGDGSGHGLRNVDERLGKTYGHGLEIRKNTPHGTVAIIKIPAKGET